MARLMRRGGGDLKTAQSNNGMHPTRFSTALVVSSDGFGVVSGRVMPGVRFLDGDNYLSATCSEDSVSVQISRRVLEHKY